MIRNVNHRLQVNKIFKFKIMLFWLLKNMLSRVAKIQRNGVGGSGGGNNKNRGIDRGFCKVLCEIRIEQG